LKDGSFYLEIFVFLDILRRKSTLWYRSKKRESERESVFGGRERRGGKVVIANPSIRNVANEEVYTSCLDAQLL